MNVDLLNLNVYCRRQFVFGCYTVNLIHDACTISSMLLVIGHQGVQVEETCSNVPSSVAVTLSRQ